MRFLITLIAATASLAAAPMDQEEQRLGFVALSDGKTFDGWKHPGNWEIQDGAFARVRPSGQLTYEARTMPDDFELRFDWKVSKGCNSGVYYRPGQVEYQVLDDIDSPYGENCLPSPLDHLCAPRSVLDISEQKLGGVLSSTPQSTSQRE